jgi:hypothetical protein
LKRVPDWLPPFAGALLAFVAMHAAWLLSRSAGLVPDCIPHIEGCTSVSRAARQGAGNLAFKALMIPAALAQARAWAVAARWVADRGGEPRGLVPLGLVANVALVVYATFLGTEGDVYGWLRRYGITFYFAGSFCAMLVLIRQLRSVVPGSGLARAMLWTCAAMLVLGLSNVLAQLLGADADLRERVRDALEWQLVTLFTAWFLMMAGILRGSRGATA